eukprot:CAMPEP_0180120210 /NCGR_PEP_ID=MMETSP0986-20121125/2394_1 /TAXON_ID=697907 /ORGANISM="non described non described, Strain CCMP2293" /LENGTH=59 /DNA_ID=CAMNT_0022059263 /DNA_START=313 /DNA_END=492 /DNA_ORIENTATION=+
MGGGEGGAGAGVSSVGGGVGAGVGESSVKFDHSTLMYAYGALHGSPYHDPFMLGSGGQT